MMLLKRLYNKLVAKVDNINTQILTEKLLKINRNIHLFKKN